MGLDLIFLPDNFSLLCKQLSKEIILAYGAYEFEKWNFYYSPLG